MPRISASERTATRQRLIEAGKAEFAERGLAGARFDEISIAAGHAKGTIYNYFDSKEALFFTIVEEWCTSLTDAAYSTATASARERLRAVAALDVEITRKDPDLARVVMQHVPALSSTHREAIDAAVGPGVDLLAETIAGGLDSGEFRSRHQPTSLARLFLGVLSVVEQEALLPDTGIELDDVVDLTDTLFIEGLAA